MGLTLLDAQSQIREAHATASPDGAVRFYSAGAVGSQYHVTIVAPNGSVGVPTKVFHAYVFTAASKHVLYSV